MREIEINYDNLKRFIEHIREQDKEELIYFLGDNYKEKFIKTVINSSGKTYFLEYNNMPSCIGGIAKTSSGGQIWLLCGCDYDKTYLFKYVKNKLNTFKKENNYLYNYIYKSNFKFLKWLEKEGFKVKDTCCQELKFFYYERIS